MISTAAFSQLAGSLVIVVLNAILQLVEGDQIHWRGDLVPFYQL